MKDLYKYHLLIHYDMIVMIFLPPSQDFDLLYTAAWGNLPLVCSDPHMVCSTNDEYEYRAPKIGGEFGISCSLTQSRPGGECWVRVCAP